MQSSAAANYPTVAVGEERLRITPTPGHTVEQMEHLVSATTQVFNKLGIKRRADWVKVGGRAGVGASVDQEAEKMAPVWTDKQLGFLDGTAPKTLNSTKAVVDLKAIREARKRFDFTLEGGKVDPVMDYKEKLFHHEQDIPTLLSVSA